MMRSLLLPRTIGGVAMTERLNETNASSHDQVAPREKRAEWERPQLRKLDMGKAEVSFNLDVDGPLRTS